MATAALRAVSKVYPDHVAVDRISLEIGDGEFLVLVGPSGCGKSTTLRMVAGLDRATSGDILIDGKRVNDLPPRDRDIAMVFQNYALYPHLTVFENLAYALRRRGFPNKEIDVRVRQAAKSIDLDGLLTRRPSQLSGGQRQRVALGRAIVRQPKLFLMDEPLSNLDAKLRSQTRSEITRLQQSLGVTTLYVTHDQTEAMTMGNRIVVMNGGRIQQVASPRELYDNPSNVFVAQFIGTPPMNLLECRIEVEDRAVRLMRDGLKLDLASEGGDALTRVANLQTVLLGFRPEAATIDETGGPGHLRGTVAGIEDLGHETLLALAIEDGRFQVRVVPAGGQSIRVGEQLSFRLSLAKLRFFHPATGEALATAPQMR